MLAPKLLMTIVSLIYLSDPITSEHEACKTVVWITKNWRDEAKSCWNMSDGTNWYGGGTETDPKWPLQTHDGFAEMAAITGSQNGRKFSFDAKFWLNSDGFSIHVPTDIPLYLQIDPVDSKNRQFCLIAKNQEIGPYFSWLSYQKPTLSYRICYANDVTDLAQFYLDVAPSVFRFPAKIPDRTYFENPVWSTWPGLQNKLDHTTLEYLAQQIRHHSENDSEMILRVGRGWESCMGEYQFATTRFPDPKTTIQRLKEMKFKVLMRAHPFVAQKCAAIFRDAAEKNFFVTKDRSRTIIMANLEEQMMANLDFTDVDENGAIAWWSDKLTKIVSKYGVDGFYFEFGQVYYLLNNAKLTGPINSYSSNYVSAAAQFGDSGSVTVGTGDERHVIFAELQKESSSTWTATGLKGVIPAVLQMGLTGYPFVLTDPIGGGNADSLPEKKLYVRWMQLATLLPTMHFTWQFWQYDKEVIEIAKNMMAIRKGFVDTIIKLAEEAATTGSPIARPIWWIAPNDERAQRIDDQFLLGNDVMVAPIVDVNDEREIYIPPGNWRDAVSGTTETGPKIVKKTAKLSQLFYFTRI